jgi:hypothetical protein
MRAIDKLIEWWDAESKKICPPDVGEIHDMARRLAEEKSGDEGVLNEDSVRGAIANILDMNDDVAQHMDITIKGEPTVLVSYLKDLISRHPTPSRTGELVKRLRELIARRYTNGVRGGWGDDIEEILRDFEGGE